ncbi:hypothetical protein [Pseudarcicella hirudinis]|uniref:hypothetical protein n=1 Tax=Pseudarcicella hirudinis TaxID=1079859 RepID=UPI0011604C96|nr:hypothetical protein [Pseudarcicella hirudinis]
MFALLLIKLNSEITLKRWKFLLLRLGAIAFLLACLGFWMYYRQTDYRINAMQTENDYLAKVLRDNQGKRSALQKSFSEAIEKGLNTTSEIEKKDAADQKSIENASMDRPDSARNALWNKYYGSPARLYSPKR